MKHVGNGRMVHSQGSALAVWRSTVELVARESQVRKIDGAVSIQLHFFLRRPRTVTRQLPTVPPDLDKLIRAVLDALSGTAYDDDSQVVEIKATKAYSDQPGVEISIRPVELEIGHVSHIS